MSMENKDKPAFPIVGTAFSDRHEGLTKREYIAAMAMQGILSGTSKYDDRYHVNGGYLHFEFVATVAVSMADALLQELSKTPNP